METEEKHSWWHYDGIFCYRKSFHWDPITSIADKARAVIKAFSERERPWKEQAAQKKKVWDTLTPEEKLKSMQTEWPAPDARRKRNEFSFAEKRARIEDDRKSAEARNRAGGRFRLVWMKMSTKDVGLENQSASENEAFPTPSEPDYPDLLFAGYYHENFCWTVALTNAFRIFDLLGVKNVEFPFGWQHVNCPSEHPNQPALMASASYLMGVYFTKAQAMQRVPEIYRAKTMTHARRGKLNSLGDIIFETCAEMHAAGLPLKGNKASVRLLEFLQMQGRAQLNPPMIDGQDAPSWKIGKIMKRYRDKHGIFFG